MRITAPPGRAAWRAFVGALLIACALPRPTAATTTSARQPRTIRELADSIDHTLEGLLTGEERRMFSTMSPEQIRSVRPDLYKGIQRDVKRWTDDWLAFVRETVPPIPDPELRRAQELAHRTDGLLRSHFAGRRWPYRTMQVSFLPAQVFMDERVRGRRIFTGGMFMRFYPELFFAAIDWPSPLPIVLVHESLHFNKRGTPWGVALSEAITETATRDLVVRLGLQTEAEVRRHPAYTQERKGVDFVLDEIMRRSGASRPEALERFLEAYLSGNQEPMAAIFGAEAWSRVLALGASKQTWQTHHIARALASL